MLSWTPAKIAEVWLCVSVSVCELAFLATKHWLIAQSVWFVFYVQWKLLLVNPDNKSTSASLLKIQNETN